MSSSRSKENPDISKLVLNTMDVAQPSSSTTAPAPPTTSVLFARGVLARLALWPALRAAVDNAWGGPASASKRTWLASVLVDAFETETDPAPDAEYVAATLLQVMEDEFDVVLEDGSEDAVARDVVRLWGAVNAGTGAGGEGERAVREVEARAEEVRGKTVEVEVEDAEVEADGSGSEWEDEEDEGEDEAPQLLDRAQRAPKPEPVVDEDGFTLVQGKGKGR